MNDKKGKGGLSPLFIENQPRLVNVSTVFFNLPHSLTTLLFMKVCFVNSGF